MLNEIYILLPQDVIDFNALNALPENNHGPMVMAMSYENMNDKSSVKMNFSGAPNATVNPGFRFSEMPSKNIWEVSTEIIFDPEGKASNVYAECNTMGEIVAEANTLINIVDINAGITSATNPYSAVVSHEQFYPCVDKSTIDTPLWQPWADAMENNQPIATRQVITINLT